VLAGVAVLCAPVLLILISDMLGSNALGWFGGLSLMITVMSAPLLALAATGGWLLARRSAKHGESSVVSEPDLPLSTAQPTSLSSKSASTSTVSPVTGRWREQRGLLVVMAGVASAFWVVITIGFRLNDQNVPAELDAGLIPALLVLITTLTLGVRYLWPTHGMSTPAPRSFRRFPRLRSREMAEYKAWRAAIANSPRRKRYAEMLDAGDVFWTPDRVEYDLDPQATTCCVHLAPIELAMRECGLRVQLDSIRSIRAKCRINAALLAQRFVLPDCVVYEELNAYDRSTEDPPQAVLSCAICGSRAWVVHPLEAAPETPVFPAD